MKKHNVYIWVSLIILLFLSPLQILVGQTDQNTAKKPKNVIIMIGDGMGITQVSLMYYRAQLNGAFYLDSFPVVGLQKTHSFSSIITDSGAAATAMATGQKTYNSAVGVGADSAAYPNLFEMAKAKSLKTGLVVTSSITDATPAAFMGHQLIRGFKEQIAMDYLKGSVDFIIGGGSDYFDSRFLDKRNLMHEMKDQGYFVHFMNNKNFHRKISPEHEKYLFLMAEKNPLPALQGRDYFASGIETSCSYLNDQEAGFFMMAEAAQIDFACHKNAEAYLVMELLDFNEAIGKAYKFAQKNGETLVIVTADHECGDLIIKPTKKGNKPKFAFNTARHTPQMVPVFAFGPGSEQFNGIYENTEIFYKIKTLLSLN